MGDSYNDSLYRVHCWSDWQLVTKMKTLTNWKGMKPDVNSFGFLYLIVNTHNRKLYVGRKQYHRWSKGKKGPESDWKTYKSSSKSLHKDMKKHGEDKFEFYIIANCETRGELVYSESNF